MSIDSHTFLIFLTLIIHTGMIEYFQALHFLKHLYAMATKILANVIKIYVKITYYYNNIKLRLYYSYILLL